MAEYIEREALMNWVKEFYPNDKHFLSGVINAPTADVVEVKHGKWIKDRNCYTCSECGFYYFANNSKANYCPNCGAKIDKEENL